MLRKRWLVALFLLWSLAVSQLVRGHEEEQERVAEVFAQVGEQEQMGVVEYYGTYDGEYLEDSARGEFLKKIAKELGITDHMEISGTSEGGREETRLTKEGSNADTVLRLLTSTAEGERKQYIIIKITMKGDMENAYAYREKLNELLEPYSGSSKSSANIIGTYDGKLSLEERNEIADRLLDEMDARVVSENREMQLYTIYGYTPWIEDYEMQEEEPFNVNIAMHYNRTDDKTYVYAAVPAVGLDY